LQSCFFGSKLFGEYKDSYLLFQQLLKISEIRPNSIDNVILHQFPILSDAETPTIKLSGLLSSSPATGIELISQLLAFIPQQRISARQAMNHPFFELEQYTGITECQSEKQLGDEQISKWLESVSLIK